MDEYKGHNRIMTDSQGQNEWYYYKRDNEMKCQLLIHVQLFAVPWTVDCQVPPSMGFSRQEYWSGLPYSSPGDLPHPGFKPASLTSPALQVDSLSFEPPGKPHIKLLLLLSHFSRVRLCATPQMAAHPRQVLLLWLFTKVKTAEGRLSDLPKDTMLWVANS